MAIRSASVVMRAWQRLLRQHRRRPIFVLLSLTLVMTSVNLTTAAKPEPEDSSATFEEFVTRGPHEALSFNPAGKIVPKPQSNAELGELAKAAATSLEDGVARGYVEVAADFAVTLTPEGRDAAQKVAEEMSLGCGRASSISADWTGIRVEIEATCTEEEQQELIDSMDATSGVPGPATVTAAGLAPGGPSQPEGDAALVSPEWDCVLEILATFGVFVSAAALITIPWLGWIWFTVVWSGFSVIFLRRVLDTIQNCTDVIQTWVERNIWVSSNSFVLPIAAVGIGSWRITDGPTVDDDPDGVWVRVRRYCSRTYYFGYRYYSAGGYSVPLGVRYGSC